jgi:Sulfatase-modifying factor enzyme 1
MGSHGYGNVVFLDPMGVRRLLLTWVFLLGGVGCVGSIDGTIPDEADAGQPPTVDDAAGPRPDAGGDAGSACPADMALVGATCMDRYEAPNVEKALPFVMYSFDEAEAWCGARGKRLCYDDEWERACAGSAGSDWVYGGPRVPGRCNDAKPWLPYAQVKLDTWPIKAAEGDVVSLDDLFARARDLGGSVAVDHLESLYQAAGAGTFAECVNEHRIFDLSGNVEEWTRRRSGGTAGFHGNLKGRYWAETRTCGNDIVTHADAFRFYEIGFRCCQSALSFAR